MRTQWFGKSDQGFSLVESLIAILLLVIMFTGGMAFFYQAEALYQGSLRQRLAAGVANTRLEVCRNTGYTNLKNTGETVCRDPGTSVTLGNVNATRSVTVADTGSYAAVSVSVNWQDPVKGHTPSIVSVQTMVSQ